MTEKQKKGTTLFRAIPLKTPDFTGLLTRWSSASADLYGLPSNKINCLTAWFTFFAMFVLLAGVCLSTLNTGVWPIFVVICGILFVVPVIFTVIAIAEPIRREKPNYNLKQLLILSAIISSIIILLSLGINILFINIKFSEVDKVATQILLPSILGLVFPITVFIYDKCVNFFAE